MRRLLPVLAILLLPSAPARAVDEALATLQKEFPAQVVGRAEGAARAAAVGRVAAFDSPEGARLLVDGLEALGKRIEEDDEATAALRKRYDEINVKNDVLKDGYKTRTDLQNKLVLADSLQREDRRVLDAFVLGVRKYRDAKSFSTLTVAIHGMKSPTGRLAALEGLAGSESGVDAAVRLAKGGDAQVVGAVLRGFRGRKEDGVFTYAVDALKSESWPVRLEAIGVLEGVNQPRVLAPLIDDMAREDGRMREELRDVLRRLTSQNFDVDPEEWKRWFLTNREELEGAAPGSALFGSFKGKGFTTPEKKSVYGIESRSRKIVFIIDTSGSMKEPLHSPPKGTVTGLTAEQEEEMNMRKIDLAKRELKRALRTLEEGATFNIIAFATQVTVWKPKMVKMDMKTRNEAMAFINDLEAAGGTWSYGALQEAFRFAGMGVLDKYYDPAADTFYFISDGAPTDNDMDKPQLVEGGPILDAVKEWNRLGKVVVHAIAIDPRAGGGRFVDFMKKLAAQNKGQYTQRD